MRPLLVGYNKRDCLIYNTKGTSANPPKEGMRISLRSQSERILIFGHSFTKEVNIRNPRRLQEVPDIEAMHRPIGTMEDSQVIWMIWARYCRTERCKGRQTNR